MGEKKDIGQFFENRLNEGKKSPNKNLWDEINTSLEEIERRKKIAIRYWIAGLGIFILVGLFILINPLEGDKHHSDIPEKNNSTEIPFWTLEKPTNEMEVNISMDDSLENARKLADEPIGITTNTEEPKMEVTQNPSEIVSEDIIKKSSPKSPSIDETFMITEKYYYYNSEDGKQWSTTDKNKIDSLLSEKNRILDSTITKKKDSLVE